MSEGFTTGKLVLGGEIIISCTYIAMGEGLNRL
jgi:hypothetical protein